MLVYVFTSGTHGDRMMAAHTLAGAVNHLGLLNSNMSRVRQYQCGLCMRPMGW